VKPALIKTRSVDLSRADFAEPLSEPLQRILLARKIYCDADLDQNLSQLEPPAALRGMDAAVRLLMEALEKQQRVLICGDYDADGATSTALLLRVLRKMGLQQIDFLVPNRFDFGYGLSPELVAVAARSKPDLIITVDNGISSIDGVAAAQRAGIRVLVTDHHLPGEQLPAADAILNPNQPGCTFPAKNLAGVGVAFYLALGLRGALRESDWFAKRQIPEPRLADYLDLVALGTVADLVPLDRLNRILVSQGLRLIQSGRGNAGIRGLFAVARRDHAHARSADLGFAIGPRINAAGRLDDISLGIACMLEEDPFQAQTLALELHEINLERRQIQEQMGLDADAALEQVETAGELPWGYCCYQPDWHQGLVGLVASRLKERLHRPVIAFARAKQEEVGETIAGGAVNEPVTDGANSELKGSARSIPGCHIRDCLALVESRHPGLIIKFGGHAMAAGLSIDERNFAAFSAAFDLAVHQAIDATHLQAITWVDGELPPHYLNLNFAHRLEQLLPWGQALPEPQFIDEWRIVNLRWLKEIHLKLKLEREGLSEALDAIWFNAPEDLELTEGQQIKLVYRVEVNRYRDKESLQLMVVAAAENTE